MDLPACGAAGYATSSAGKRAWRTRTDHLYGGPAAIDLMMILVQDSGTQIAAGNQRCQGGQRLRDAGAHQRSRKRVAARTAGGRYLCLNLESPPVVMPKQRIS